MTTSKKVVLFSLGIYAIGLLYDHQHSREEKDYVIQDPIINYNPNDRDLQENKPKNEPNTLQQSEFLKRMSELSRKTSKKSKRKNRMPLYSDTPDHQIDRDSEEEE